jgi:hypothetical protein
VILRRVLGMVATSCGMPINLWMLQDGTWVVPPTGPCGCVRRGRTEVPMGPTSSDEGEKEWRVTRPSLCPPHVVSSQPQSIGSLLTGPLIGERRSKCLQAGGGPSSGPSGHPPPTRVNPVREEGVPLNVLLKEHLCRLLSGITSWSWVHRPL